MVKADFVAPFLLIESEGRFVRFEPLTGMAWVLTEQFAHQSTRWVLVEEPAKQDTPH